MAEQPRVLKYVSQLALMRRPVGRGQRKSLAGQIEFTFGRGFQSGEATQQRGFAGTTGTKDAAETACR